MVEEIFQNMESVTFAGLFLGMLIYTMKTNDKREQRYQKTIDDNQEMVKDALHRMKDIEEVKGLSKKIYRKVGGDE